ncbi:MAG: hypothetical protein Q7T04_04935 [Dehalococcoidia bacterium]|nr:hypothetical protein [Dehalococcoidia bacterium]
MQNPMGDLNKCLAVLMLRTAKCKQIEVAEKLGYGKKKVVATEKWFRELKYDEAYAVCYDHAVECVRVLEIDPLKKMLLTATLEKLDKVSSMLILGKYGHVKIKEPSASKLLTPRPSEHHARLARAAEQLRLNIKKVKETEGATLDGDIMRGYIITAGSRTKEELLYVDRLDAECVLSHLKEMWPDFNYINGWQDFNSMESVASISDFILKRLKDVSHGLAIDGKCKICTSWG